MCRIILFFLIAVSFSNISLALPKSGCLTSGCHEDLSKKHLVTHGPFKEAKGCLVCHYASKRDRPKDPSNKELAHKKLLKLTPENVNNTCLLCHDEMKAALGNVKEPHKKVTEKACSFCHNPHSSDHKKLFRDDTFSVRCFACHEKLKPVVQGAKTHHGAVVDEKSCTNCHTFHVTEHKKLLKAEPQELCIKCHSEEQKADNGRIVPAIAKKLKDLKFVHKPVASKCISCHQPHGSQNENLLELTITKDFYSTFQESNFKLCMDCHEPALATNVHTKTDTEFRNGLDNLHFVHSVQRGAKGLNCLVCHDVHAASQARIMRDSYVFDKVQVPLKFEKTKSGGTCATACHSPKTYDRTITVEQQIVRPK